MNSCTTRHCNSPLNEMGTTKSMRRELSGLYWPWGLTNGAPWTISAKCPGSEWRQLWQRPAHKHGSSIRPQTARPDQHNHVLSGLELRLQLAEVAFAVDWLFVDFQDNVAPAYANVVGKTARLHILNDHALGIGQLHPVRQIGRDVLHVDAQLALLRLSLVFACVFVAQTAGKQLLPIGNGHLRGALLAIADVTELGDIARLQGRDFSHQFVPGRYRLSIHRSDGVAREQAGLGRGTTRRDIGDRHSGGDAINTLHSRIRNRVELDADRSARDLVVRCDELVVDLHHRVR